MKKNPLKTRGETRVFAHGEDIHSLHLTSELVDLREGYANPSNVNEIVRCTMKSSLSSDEIFSLRLQMKSNPPIFCRKADFIAKRFHSLQVDLFRRRRI